VAQALSNLGSCSFGFASAPVDCLHKCRRCRAPGPVVDPRQGGDARQAGFVRRWGAYGGQRSQRARWFLLPARLTDAVSRRVEPRGYSRQGSLSSSRILVH